MVRIAVVIWDEFGYDLGNSINNDLVTHYHMAKLVSVDEIRKQDDQMQQKSKQPEKISQRFSDFRSKLTLSVIIGSMASLDLAFMLLIISWIQMK